MGKPLKETRRKIILIMRIAGLLLFVAAVVPYTFFRFGSSLDEIITVDTIDEEGYTLLSDQFDVLKSLPENSTIDKLVYRPARFPGNDFSYIVTCAIPDKDFNSFIDEQPYETGLARSEQEGESYTIRLVSDDSEMRTVNIHYTVENGAGAEFATWIKRHGANSVTLPLIGYWLAVVLAIVLLIFPYGKIKNKRAD